MSDAERNEKVNSAIRNIASLIAGNDGNLYNALVSIFHDKVKIHYGAQNENPNYAAGCSSSSSIVDGKNNNINIDVNLRRPPISITTPEYNWWIVDVHHELFHAFTKILNSGKLIEKSDDKTTLASTGGKITVFNDNNGIKVNGGDLPVSKLFNELTTDLMAYILTYNRFFGVSNIKIDEILNGTQLELIASVYKFKNGYYELLQLGLLISAAFTNYPANYDYIENKGKSFFDLKFGDMQYNDLFNGIMYNPLDIKNKLLESISIEDWNKLNESSKKIISSFENGGRIVERVEISNVMKIMKHYFDNKIQKMRDQNIDEEIIQRVERDFEARYQYVANYYGILDLVDESNIRNVR